MTLIKDFEPSFYMVEETLRSLDSMSRYVRVCYGFSGAPEMYDVIDTDAKVTYRFRWTRAVEHAATATGLPASPDRWSADSSAPLPQPLVVP